MAASQEIVQATKLGKRGLDLAKLKVREFTGEAMKR